jgi:hypothetical protein
MLGRIPVPEDPVTNLAFGRSTSWLSPDSSRIFRE